MLMENCCYGREELTVLNMVKKGLFGECLHAKGGYRHDLRDQVCMGKEIRHYRLENYLHRNGDVYPPHDLGPIAKYLDINRGNRMLPLTAMASKSVGLNHWSATHKGKCPKELINHKFVLGDVGLKKVDSIVLSQHCVSINQMYCRVDLKRLATLSGFRPFFRSGN